MREQSPSINSLVVKIAERCNLACTYCYMYNHADQSYRRRPVMMSDATFAQLLERIAEYCDAGDQRGIGIVFHGGEPMLVGAERMSRFASAARERLGDRLRHLRMQSNATLVDDAMIEVLRAHNIRVGVSMDGPAKHHDLTRIDHAGAGSHAKVVDGIARLRAAGAFDGVLCVVNPSISGLEVYEHFRALGIDRMNFLLPDVTHDTKNALYGDCGETPVADYLLPIFDAWYAEDDPTVHVRIFEQLIRLMLGGASAAESFGNPLVGYVVIDTDGTIQANDALKVCDEGIAETGLDVFANGFDDIPSGKPLLHLLLQGRIPLSAQCRSCPERTVCGAGHVPHRYKRGEGFEHPSAWCADILRVIARIRGIINLPRAS